MATEGNPAAAGGGGGGGGGSGKTRKRKYLPHGKPPRKGAYPLRPGVQGFFLTCDGGRERQATNEALNLLDTFYEELVHGKGSGEVSKTVPTKPPNKIIKFKDSDSSSNEDEDEDEPNAEKHTEETENSTDKNQGLVHEKKHAVENEDSSLKEQHQEPDDKHEEESESLPTKKQCLETDASKCEVTEADKSTKKNDKPIDELIEEELKELGDRKKRRFASLDSGCNGCIFIQMPKRAGDPGPVGIVQHMITSAAATRKHISRFLLRVLPAEVTCYASEEEITKAIQPLIEQYFPAEAPTPQKFAVLYEARANTGVERMPIINAVAKCVPQPHKVDLKNPDKTIIVQIVKTVCLVGVVERYKELSKYNLRQLTSPEQ